MPFLFIFFIATNEFNELAKFNLFHTGLTDSFIVFLVIFTLVIVCGCILCFSQIWCTTSNNAITTSVIGVLKSFLQTLLGMFFYDAYKNMSVLSFIGIIINLIFGTWYTYLKYIERESRSHIILTNLNDEDKN